MLNFLKRKPIVFEGKLGEQHKRTKQKWLRLLLVGTVLPFMLPLILSSIIDFVNVWEVVGDGEIILTSFTVTLSLVFDIYSIKEQRKEDEHLDNAFAFALILTAVQLVVYAAVKASNSETKVLKSVLWSLVIIICTCYHCDKTIDAMFLYSNDSEEGAENA